MAEAIIFGIGVFIALVYILWLTDVITYTRVKDGDCNCNGDEKPQAKEKNINQWDSELKQNYTLISDDQDIFIPTLPKSESDKPEAKRFKIPIERTL